jgi:hypothetical protein
MKIGTHPVGGDVELHADPSPARSPIKPADNDASGSLDEDTSRPQPTAAEEA